MKVFTCPQLSPEWYELHRGRVTGSSMDKILTPKTMQPSASQEGLMYQLISQVLSPYPMGDGDGYASRAMQNGMAIEPEARNWYAMRAEDEVTQVGFLMSDCERFGVSPDSLVGEEGGLEIKGPTPKVQAQRLCEGIVPREYLAQIHGSLVVSGRKWWDWMSYCPDLEGTTPLVVRVFPNEYTAALKDELERFWEKYQAALAKVRGK